MILEILIFLLTTLVVYCWFSYKKLLNNFKQRDVKFLPGVPVLGNLLRSTFLKRHYLHDIQDVYDAFPEDKYVGFMELDLPVLLIRDPELIRKITVKDFHHFTDHREFITKESHPLFAGSVLLMKGERWRNMRVTLSPVFTASKMKYMMPLMLENTNNIIEFLEKNQSQNIEVDDLARRYTNDVITSAAFGIKINSLKERDNEFFRIGCTVFEFTLKQKLLAMLATSFPELSKKLGLSFFPARTCNFFKNILKSTIEYRKKEKVERLDLINILMDAPGEFTPDELRGQVFFFFAAGFDTSATAIVMVIHELAVNPDVQEKLYQECRKLKEEKELTFDNMNELKYLDCVINESLRKWSPAIFMSRTCVKTFEMPPPREGGRPYIVKPGEIVYNMVNCLQMDPKYFPDPEIFNPDRFSEKNKHNITPFTHQPFGAGPRICIGMRFAIMETKVLLYHILLNFSIMKSEKTVDPIKLKPHIFNIKALNGTWVKFEKRESL